MLSGIRVVGGGALSGKTRRLIGFYREILANDRPGSALWLSPTYRHAATVALQVADSRLSGCLAPNCLTFDQFARRVLEASSACLRPLDPALARQLLHRLVDEAVAGGELDYFAPIARTRGFLDLLAQHIRELKRLEIWPEELARTALTRSSAKHRQLCRLYERYQQLLNEHDLYDAEGRFWSARARLREGQRKPFEGLRHVLVDGFADFTRTEHEMLEILAGACQSVTISLPLEPNSRRAQLFAKPAKTLDELRRRHPQLTVEELGPPRSAVGAIGYLEAKLFTNPREPLDVCDATGVEIVSAAGATHEIELVAGRIKRLLSQGDPRTGAAVRPDEVLVVFRSLSDSAEAVENVFARYGVPVAVGERPALGRAGIAGALLTWLRLDRENWPFRQVLAILTHNYFKPDWPEWRGETPWPRPSASCASCKFPLAVVPCSITWRTSRRARRSGQSNAPGTSSRRSALGKRARRKLAAALLARLAEALDRLPRLATLAAWIEALEGFASDVGLRTSASTLDDTAWRQLLDALAASGQLSSWVDGKPREYTPQEFTELVEDIARTQRLAVSRDEAGRVRVLSAESARNLPAPYVFLAGLSERSFPPHEREECLHSEAETRQLAEAGLPLVPRGERRGHEMLLFYEVVTRATRHLTLSYPALDGKAQPLSPSPYLREVERVLGLCPAPPRLAYVPESDEVLSPRELRVRAVAEVMAGDTRLWRTLGQHETTRGAAANVEAALRAGIARGRGESFGAFEGMLVTPAVARLLAGRYGSDHCWSPSQLEQYARCPYEFFLSRVLAIEPVEEPALEVDYLARGRLVHELLSTWHQQHNERSGAAASPIEMGEAAFAAEVEVLLAALVAAPRRPGAR